MNSSGTRLGQSNLVRTVIVPPAGVNLQALLARLLMICLRRISSPTTMPDSSLPSEASRRRMLSGLSPSACHAATRVMMSIDSSSSVTSYSSSVIELQSGIKNIPSAFSRLSPSSAAPASSAAHDETHTAYAHSQTAHYPSY